MDRYVHHELRSVYTALAALAVSLAATSGVHGAPMTAYGVGRFALGLVAFAVVCTLLGATRLKWVGEIRDFEAAIPLPEAPAKSIGLRRHPLNWWLFTVMTVPTLVLAIAWAPWIALLPLWPALAWLGQIWLAVDWERRNGRVLWRGADSDAPWKLAYSVGVPSRNGAGAPAGTTPA
ncbi:hypothetical protein [Streptomyces sp. NPDC046909]|uniref:hypothetical protein n=1 Tax=Streptomyces sp. NPDC046909 TaxID=3155617 RepID=UPI00340CB8ED